MNLTRRNFVKISSLAAAFGCGVIATCRRPGYRANLNDVRGNEPGICHKIFLVVFSDSTSPIAGETDQRRSHVLSAGTPIRRLFPSSRNFSEPPERALDCIRRVHAGQTCLPVHLAAKPANQSCSTIRCRTVALAGANCGGTSNMT